MVAHKCRSDRLWRSLFGPYLFFGLVVAKNSIDAAMVPRPRRIQLLEDLSLATKTSENSSITAAPSPESSIRHTTTAPTGASTEETEFLPLDGNETVHTHKPTSTDSPAPSEMHASHLPSIEPSHNPSQPPSKSPSSSPTPVPSTYPTPHPSPIPSSAPTIIPSAIPSTIPTFNPTIVCHDHSNYRSPINDLTCEDHRGTNCIHWRILGLNTTQLAELIEMCPDSCQIPCGSFIQFSVSLGFTISEVPGLMDSAEKRDLEVVTRQHLLAYIRTKVDRKIAFEFDQVELVSQALLEEESTYQPSHFRRAQKDYSRYTSLEVRMEFTGFTIGISHRDASQLLIAGVDSETFGLALQTAGDFFAKATISSAAEENVPFQKPEGDGKGASPATVVLSLLFVVLVTVLVFRSWLSRERSGKWLPRFGVFSHYDMNDDSESHSPLRRGGEEIFSMPSLPGIDSIFPLANTSSMLSFDDSRASTHQAGNGAQLLRMITSLSLSRSRSPTDSNDSLKSPGGITIDNELLPSRPLSPYSCKDSEKVGSEHPLSEIVPPMIVIDHIDDQKLEIGASETYAKAKTSQFPARRMGASTSFLSALRAGQKDCNPRHLYTENSAFAPNLSLQNSWPYPEDHRPFSPFGLIMDSDSEDDASVASTPVCPKIVGDELPFRRSLSSNALDGRINDKPENVSIFHSDPVAIGRHASAASCHTVERQDVASLTPVSNQLPTSEADVVKRTISADSDEVDNPRPDCTAPTPERTGGSHASPLSSNMSTQSRIWSLSSVKKARRDPALKQKGTFSKIVDFSGFKKFHSIPAPWDWQSNEADSIGIVTDHSLEARDDKPTRHEFEAPRKGQLGLVIESDAFTGPVIHAVKDYSPLLGLAQQGDKVVEVDGKNTCHCTLTDMSRLLSTKPGLRPSAHPNLRIAVMRPLREDIVAPRLQAHVRDGSHGSNSTPHFGLAPSSDDAPYQIPGSSSQSIRAVHFRDDAQRGALLSYHKPRASF